jgi:hypothetical protein
MCPFFSGRIECVIVIINFRLIEPSVIDDLCPVRRGPVESPWVGRVGFIIINV